MQQLYCDFSSFLTAPSSPVVNLTAEVLSATSMRLHWLPPSQDEWNGIITRYVIEYRLVRPVSVESEEYQTTSPLRTFVTFAPSSRQSLNNNPDPTLASLPLAWEQLEIESLEEYFIYEFSVYFENSAGRSDSGQDVELSMPVAGEGGVLHT